MARGADSARARFTYALGACAIGTLAMLLTGAADAQTRTRTLTQVERDRRAEQQRVERLRTQAGEVRREVSALDARLTEAGRRRSEAEAQALAAEQRLTALRAQLSQDDLRRARSRDALERALINAALAQRRVEPSAVRANILARALAPAVSGQELGARQRIADARLLEGAIAEEQQLLADAQLAIDTERADIVTLLARRRSAQAQYANDARAAEQRVRALASEARNLRDLAARVTASAPARAATPGGSGSGAIPAAWLAPAEGRITSAYGAAAAGAPANQGVRLTTRASAQVVSPAAGEVAYAGSFRSYGQVLILNLDGGYAVVLTGLQTINARVGDRVRAGQPLGEMSATATPAPELYVEVRRNGQPVDPGRWLSARGLAANQGVRAG
jgi:septal ring factor EnvC (AmiA/AmiB activator)